MLLFLYFLFYLFTVNAGEEIYENSTNICEKCKCTNQDIFTLDCSYQNFNYMLANWPTDKPIKAIFTGNNFTTLEVLPTTNSDLEIVLVKCNIKFINPGIFTAALNTKYVDLSYNQLTSDEVTSDKFRGPYKDDKPENLAIENLNLAYNQIHTLYSDIFDFLPNLKFLNLEGNDFKVLDVHTQLALSKASKLWSLNLANNELTELVEEAVEHLQDLVEINLSKNQLDFVPRSLETVGNSLEILNINENPIIAIDDTTFSNLPNLIRISANNLTKLKHIDPESFIKNSKLTKLSLCNNSALEFISPKAFSLDLNIKELDLSNNNLSSLGLNLDWSKLEILDLRSNPLICSCVLYNLSNALSGEITRNADSPTCLHPTTLVPLEIYSLKSDICKAKVRRLLGRIRYHHFSIPLVGLIVTLMVAILAAIALSYSRFRKFLRGRNGPYVSQVMYSPLLNAYSRA